MSQGMTTSPRMVKIKQHEGETGERLLGEGARRSFAFLAVKPLGEERDEGGVERPFGEQPAEQIGDAEGDEEGVGHGAGAEHGRDQNVPDEAEDAAEHGHRADGGECAVEGHRAAGGQRLDVRQRNNARSARADSALVKRSRIRDMRLELVIFLPVRSVT